MGSALRHVCEHETRLSEPKSKKREVLTMKGATLARDFKEDLSEQMTFELRSQVRDRENQAREESGVGRSEGRVVLAGELQRQKSE